MVASLLRDFVPEGNGDGPSGYLLHLEQAKSIDELRQSIRALREHLADRNYGGRPAINGRAWPPQPRGVKSTGTRARCPALLLNSR